jgi:Flp pilus assembly protein TadG
MMRTNGRHRRRGSALIEFTLVGIPILFALISIFEVSRAMWIYVTVAHSVKEGLRFAIVHGNNCTIAPNSCRLQLRDIAARIANTGVGLLPEEFTNIEFISSTRTETCSTLDSCLTTAAGNTYWPTAAPGVTPADVGSVRGADLEIRGRYQFTSLMLMFWPGAGSAGKFGAVTLGASAKESIQY